MKVEMRVSDSSGALNLTFLEDTGKKLMVAKPVRLDMVEVSDHCEFEPTLRIPRRDSTGLLRSLAEAVDRLGRMPPRWELLQGQLEAAKENLADLRRERDTLLSLLGVALGKVPGAKP